MSCDDFDEGIPGICPPAVTCKISHASIYPNKVGIYPSDFLPSKRTTWHASFAANFAAAGPAGGEAGRQVGTILGILGGAPGAEFIPNLGQVITFQSYHTVIFARTANRLNVAHVITQDEINSTGEYGLPVVINVDEYIFEAVAATDIKIDENSTTLTEQEIEEIISSGENESDRAFRKLFEISIPNNRLLGIEFNKLGTEYRLDNGTNKERLALDSAGLGDLDNPSYRDASSKLLKINLTSNRINADGDTGSPPKAGDVIYLTYVAVKEHYIRQNVNATWQVFDFGSQLECISLLLGFKVQNYRFYEWELESSGGPAPRLAGWRVVESFNSRVNHVSTLGGFPTTSILGDISIANNDIGLQTSSIIPGIVTIEELQDFINNPGSQPTVTVNQFVRVGNIDYHPNSGTNGNQTAYLNSEWFRRANFNAYNEVGKTYEHVLFNVHPKALRKRDLDKWGIERFLAVEVEKDIKSGKNSFFPFMDDPGVDDPTKDSKVYLDGSNFKLEPLEPISRFSNGNFKGCCGSLGTFTTVFQLISGGPDQNVQQRDGINTFHRFSSNLITERFDEETRVLVERNFPQATNLGPNIIAIDGVATTGGAVTCIMDPSKSFAFAGHLNSDNFLVYNSFNIGFLHDSLRSFSFRPDLDIPPLEDNNEPKPDQFDSRLGFTGNLGNRPGRRPGRAVSLADYAPLSSFLYKTTNKIDFLEKHKEIPESNVEQISFTKTDDKITIFTGHTYQGRLDIEYEMFTSDEDDEILLVLKVGDGVEGGVDGLRITKAQLGLLRVDMRWMRGDKLEIVGPRVKDLRIKKITVVGLDPEKSSDFLNDPTSHSLGDKTLFNDRLVLRSLLFRTQMMSISEDKRSVLYTFFEDSDGGISVVSSFNFGVEWHYFYGVVEPIESDNVSSPFCVTHFGGNVCFLFYLYAGAIFCKKISFDMFLLEDANLIERFAERFVPGTNNVLPKENVSIYSSKGESLRRTVLSQMAAGNTTESLQKLLGFDSELGILQPFELREVDVRQPDGSVVSKRVRVRKQPLVRGPRSAFTNIGIDNPFFSAYREDKGVLRLWYMAAVEDVNNPDVGSGRGGVQLQCNFSLDDGVNWYDQWEYIAYGMNRMRFDSKSGQPFIDKSASGTEPPENLEGTFNIASDEKATFGINAHWSRLKKDKVQEGEIGPNSESQIIDIASPYVFYQSAVHKVFLFYIYRECLLCKMFDDNIIGQAAARRKEQNPQRQGMVGIRQILERSTRSFFVDGHLNQPELLNELHDRYNVETDERLIDGNIVFAYQFTVERFNEDRIINPQRVCAHELPNGMIRVFYKFRGINTLKSAVWTGQEFWPEDFLKDKTKVADMIFPGFIKGTPVRGGFGSESF